MVIFSSFFNEEYLLPWWLEHHKRIFKHGVLYNYFSTDRSVEIIKEICPTWEIRDTKNKDWDFQDNDNEFMEAEREFSGYKTVLTTTEFLLGDTSTLPEDPTALAMPIIRLVDDRPKIEPDPEKPLTTQKRFGYLDKSTMRRFLHNHPDGRYGVGRHKTGHKTKESSIVIFKYVYSPWNKTFIKRKLSMKRYVNPENIARRWGRHHTWNKKKLNLEYKKALKDSYAIKYPYTQSQRNVLGSDHSGHN